MRKILITTILAALSTLLMSTGWRSDFDKAKADAQNNNKLILLKFSGSDWCVPCMRMEKDVFAQDSFQQYVAKQNDRMADEYNKRGHFPYTLLLRADGSVLKAWDGYHGEKTEAMIDEIRQYANTH